MTSTLYHHFCADFQNHKEISYLFANHQRVAVACSGGIDSMVLADLTVAYFGADCVDILIVDHGLRENSATEALQIQNYWESRGVFTKVLPLIKFSGGNKLAWARKFRYQALDHYYDDARDVTLLLVGHHGDDNAENFVLRLKRKSGIVGLAAMNDIFYLENTLIYRPLMNVFREDLQQYLKKKNLPYWHDPNNDDEIYERIQVRTLFKKGYFWNKHNIHKISCVLRQIEKILESTLDDSITQVGFVADGVFIEEACFWQLDKEQQRLLLRKMLAWVSKSLPAREKTIKEGLARLKIGKSHSIGKANCFVRHNRIWIIKNSS